MNRKQKITVVLMDIGVLAELCIAIYVANGDPDRFTPLFLKCFFAMLIPTLVLAKVIIKRLGRHANTGEIIDDCSVSIDETSGTAA